MLRHRAPLRSYILVYTQYHVMGIPLNIHYVIVNCKYPQNHWCLCEKKKFARQPLMQRCCLKRDAANTPCVVHLQLAGPYVNLPGKYV